MRIVTSAGADRINPRRLSSMQNAYMLGASMSKRRVPSGQTGLIDQTRQPANASSSSMPTAAEVTVGVTDADAEAEFLRGYDLTAFPRPSVAVDVVAFTLGGGALRVALYRRVEHPAKGRFALPGGFVGLDESLDAAARRLLSAKAGLSRVFLEQLHTFGEPSRDPRGRIISVAYYALVDAARFERARARANAAVGDAVIARVVARGAVDDDDDADIAVDVVDDDGQELRCAFDHARIIAFALQRLRQRLDDTPVGFQLLPRAFTLRQLQDVHEIVLGTAVNKDSFRRRMLATGMLEPSGEFETGVTWRPAELFRFVRRSAI
jgi:8-oxo-dGTP diphosphatase